MRRQPLHPYDCQAPNKRVLHLAKQDKTDYEDFADINASHHAGHDS